jgi:hypothetical protein
MNGATESSSSPAAMQLETDYPSPHESSADASNKMPLPMDEFSADASNKMPLPMKEFSADASMKMPLPITTGKAIREKLEELGYKEPIPSKAKITELHALLATHQLLLMSPLRMRRIRCLCRWMNHLRMRRQRCLCR